ncbi:hypothetical protein CDD83_7441 [Cordyceps sp. RAO-2017]|nr:hypothetical protein CDD83_7441 [Cordyceps sp. RAO-2017]
MANPPRSAPRSSALSITQVDGLGRSSISTGAGEERCHVKTAREGSRRSPERSSGRRRSGRRVDDGAKLKATTTLDQAPDTASDSPRAEAGFAPATEEADAGLKHAAEQRGVYARHAARWPRASHLVHEDKHLSADTATTHVHDARSWPCNLQDSRPTLVCAQPLQSRHPAAGNQSRTRRYQSRHSASGTAQSSTP